MSNDHIDPEPPPGYLLEDRISAGGSAVVHRARSRRFRDPVALKIWHEPLDAVGRERFLREIGVLRALAGDPHVIQILDAGAPPDRPAWLAMELCDESLADRMRRGPVPAGEAFALADDMLAGLAALHANGHLHRDIKPENVLLEDGVAKLGDLGITAPVTALTEHHLAGTGPYLAPELATGQPTVRTDLYAAALVLDQLFEPLGLDAVTRLLTRASSSRPADRPAGAGELRAALAALDPHPRAPAPETPAPESPATERPASESPATNSPASETPPAHERGRRLSPRLAVTIGAVLVLTTVGGWRLMPALQATADPVTPPASAPSGATISTTSAATSASPAIAPATGTSPALSTPPTGSTTSPATPPAGSRPTPAPAPVTASAGPKARPATTKPTSRASTAAVKAPDGSDCFDTAVSGSFDLEQDTMIAGGPNYTSAACHDIHIKLTSATYRTYARSCTETADGGSIVGCSTWILLSYADTWDTLSTGVAGGSRWQLQMRAEDAETVEFQYTE
ncbi:protein kinase [Actinoplanes sp. NPDC051513]|uniref:serine/threonine-protein kinase n=1 Tax=Actinoplanes sp. NPDC051513 TaxID=3363908 RepID=UPI00378920D6